MSNEVVGSSLDLKAYNSGQALGFPGGEPNTTGAFGSLLNNIDFTVLHLNIGAATSFPISSIPSSLVNNTYWTAADAAVSRSVLITNGAPGPPDPFRFDSKLFDFNYINHTVKMNDIEKWSVTNNFVFGHCFHIHDVQFKLVSRSTGSIGTYEGGWKDNFFIKPNETVSFVAKFADYSDSIHPFMYHCHFANHEDGGMMGQFVVKTSNSTSALASRMMPNDFSIFPNPSLAKIFIQIPNPQNIYYITITDMVGRTKMMLPKPDLTNGIDVSSLAKGVYILKLTDGESFQTISKQFVKE